MLIKNRVGQLAIPFSFNNNQAKEVCLDDFKGDWLWMVFHRHLA